MPEKIRLQILALLQEYMHKTRHYIDDVQLIYAFDDDYPELIDVKIKSDEWK